MAFFENRSHWDRENAIFKKRTHTKSIAKNRPILNRSRNVIFSKKIDRGWHRTLYTYICILFILLQFFLSKFYNDYSGISFGPQVRTTAF